MIPRRDILMTSGHVIIAIQSASLAGSDQIAIATVTSLPPIGQSSRSTGVGSVCQLARDQCERDPPIGLSNAAAIRQEGNLRPVLCL